MRSFEGEIHSALIRLEGIGEGVNQLRAIGMKPEAQGVLQVMLRQLEVARACLDRALGRAPGTGAPGKPHQGEGDPT